MSRSTFQTDRELLAAFRTDAAAFDAFYDRHEAPLLAFLVRNTRDAELAADLLGEVFASLIAAMVQGQEIKEPRGWLFTVARTKLIDSARRGKVEAAARERLGMSQVALTDEALERIDELADDESARARAALADLPEEQRAAVTAYVVEELGYQEVAQTLECSEAVVRKRVSRGLAQMRRALTGAQGESS